MPSQEPSEEMASMPGRRAENVLRGKAEGSHIAGGHTQFGIHFAGHF